MLAVQSLPDAKLQHQGDCVRMRQFKVSVEGACKPPSLKPASLDVLGFIVFDVPPMSGLMD